MFDARPQHNEYLRHRSAQFRSQVERRLNAFGRTGRRRNRVQRPARPHARAGEALNRRPRVAPGKRRGRQRAGDQDTVGQGASTSSVVT